ncbi:MAG TPA: 2Fe-2S iron-sulfur cluster-binding protein [Usitatibacter sp.]|nr:2Fe-2S iron-sulfur cluster-binding protein [Usitatibacter sp.]
MPRIYIDGRPYEADARQTVMEVAAANGIAIPAFCWHPKLSVSGSCRLCAVQVEGRSWVEISCNMPVTEGLRVLTDSDVVRAYRKSILQLTTLNHPVDCGICDKAGECLLQDYHYEHNGSASISRDPKVHATKFHPLSPRIVLDNERCVLCSRCVRFTHEVSKSKSLGMVQRGDTTLIRASEDGAFGTDAYSDNVVDICPVGALLSRDFLYKSRVWYLQPTRSVCPGCERGCAVNLWHRKPEWKLNSLDPAKNRAIERITPLDNPAVNGPWICNKGRDMARILERPRALQALVAGAPATLEAAIESARDLLAAARRPLALVSSWASDEELAAFSASLGARVRVLVKRDRAPEAGEVIEDGLLIRPDKNPNTAGARALFPDLWDGTSALPDADLVLAWGEGFDIARAPQGARTLVLAAWADPAHARADVLIPISLQTERHGHYTNFQGVKSAFEPCFARPDPVADAETLFARLAAAREAAA